MFSEPQAYCASILETKYSHLGNVEIINCGCGDRISSALLYHGKDGVGSELTTLSTAHDAWMDAVRDENSTEKIEIKPLDHILADKEYFVKDIGILKIDTESWDYYVLRGIDFNLHKPKIIVTEEYLWDSELCVQKHRLLESVGYINIGWIEYNTVWLRSDYYGVMWSDLILDPWLSRINRSGFPFALQNYFQDVGSLTNKTNAYVGMIGDLEVVAGIQRVIRCPAGEVVNIPITLMNLSHYKNIPSLPSADGCGQLLSSYHWQEKGEVIVWDGLRTALDRDINPRSAIAQIMDIMVPRQAGVYDLLIDLVIENVGWLSPETNYLCRAAVQVS